MKQSIIRDDYMKKEYDLGSMKSRENTYSKHLKKEIIKDKKQGIDCKKWFKCLKNSVIIPNKRLHQTAGSEVLKKYVRCLNPVSR